MTASHLLYLYFFTLGFILLNLVLLQAGRGSFLRWTGWLPVLTGVLAWTGGLLYSGHPPVYNRFGTLQQIVLVMVLLDQLRTMAGKAPNPASWHLALLLQGAVLIFGMEPDPDSYYMYQKLYVILFFQLRITSMGLFAHALSCWIGSLIPSRGKDQRIPLEHRGRNFMLLGAAVYLAAEFSGSWWAWLWWGDPWHWSKGFFFAAVMFLLALLGSHIPGSYGRNFRLKALFSLLPLCFILLTYLFSH